MMLCTVEKNIILPHFECIYFICAHLTQPVDLRIYSHCSSNSLPVHVDDIQYMYSEICWIAVEAYKIMR